MSDVRIADDLRLAAPVDVVWRAIEDPASRVGAKEGTTTERCVEREEGARIAWAIEEDSSGFGRMVSGWRSGFTVADGDGATIVTAESTFRPRNVLVRAMLPVIRRRFHQTQQAILRGLQEAVTGASRG